jgi:hypothetical protein
LAPLIERVNLLSKINGIGGIKVHTGPTGIHIEGGAGGASGAASIYEVQSAATGDGVYNCYEQKVDGSDWDSTSEVDKLADKDAISVPVFNLLESYPEATYANMLGLYDRLLGWESTDDEGAKRKVGLPVAGGFVRMARTTAAAGATQTITCNLIGFNGAEIGSGLGSGITVNCKVCGGGNLNSAIPRLADDDYLFVANIRGEWWCTTIFQTSEDCVCTPPE